MKQRISFLTFLESWGPEEPLMDSFEGHSYALEGLIHLYVRRNSEGIHEIPLA